MSLVSSIVAGLRRLLGKQFERDLDDEVSHYVTMAAREHMRAGMSRDAALRAARVAVGGVQRFKEDARAGGWEYFVDTFLRDIQYGFRSLRRSPGFTLAAVLTLAVGIGGNTTIFSLVNAILLRPPAHVRAPEQLVALFTSDYSGPPHGTSSYPDFEEFRKHTRVFAGVTAFSPRPIAVGEGEDLQRTGMELVSAEYFQVLGVEPAHGRFFLPEEGRSGVPVGVAVIGHDLWQERYGGSPSVVGQTVRLNGRTFTVIGVAPPGYSGSIRGLVVEVWVPVTAGSLVGAGDDDLTNRGNRGSMIIARLAPGVSIDQAQAAMTTLASSLATAYPDAWIDVSRSGRKITLVAERESRVPPQIRGPVLGFVALLMGTVALVLLVCCANVASLMLARATRRSREMGVRLSLGASRPRVLRQLLTESALVAVAGASAGILLTVAATRALLTFEPPLPVRVAFDLGLDARVLTFTLVAAIVTGLVFGIAPALRASRAEVTGMLKGDGAVASVSGRRISLQSALVVGQVAVSLLLLVTALFFLRSLRAAGMIDPGFATDQMLLFDAEVRPDVRVAVKSAEVGERIQRQIAGVPGVTSVSWGMLAPLGLGFSRRHFTIDGYRPAPGEDMEYHYNQVGPSYLETMRIALVRGRGITDADRPGAPRVAIVNETFANRFWPGQDALGKRISAGGPEGPWLEIVGIARDGKYLSLTEATRPYVFIPALQDPSGTVFHVRTSVPPRTLRDAVRREVTAVAPDWLVTNVRTMEEQIGVSLTPQRLAGAVLSLFGAVALLLAAVGLYGVIAYSVASRVREIGVRVALGARRTDVVRMVLRQGAILVACGVALGLPAGWAASRLLTAFLIGDATTDVMTYLGAAGLLGSIALLASWLPARRAANIHPMVALRNE
ncbi:MAG: ABC transporter permease [Gemmatimonadaceae bacterium]